MGLLGGRRGGAGCTPNTSASRFPEAFDLDGTSASESSASVGAGRELLVEGAFDVGLAVVFLFWAFCAWRIPSKVGGSLLAGVEGAAAVRPAAASGNSPGNTPKFISGGRAGLPLGL